MRLRNRYLTEAITVEGATFIGNNFGYDVFKINTFDAAQQFIVNGNNERHAGATFTQNADTFNSHINDTVNLYLFVVEDTNNSLAAVLTGSGTGSFTYSGITVGCNFMIELGDGVSTHPYPKFPFYLIPNSTFDIPEGNRNTDIQEMCNIQTVEQPATETTTEEPTQIEEPTPTDDGLVLDEPEEHEETTVEPQPQSNQSDEVVVDQKNNPFKFKVEGNHAALIGISQKKLNELVTSYGQTIEVPSEFQGKPVEVVNKYAGFMINTRWTITIKLPATIKVIKKNAFDDCSSIRFQYPETAIVYRDSFKDVYSSRPYAV